MSNWLAIPLAFLLLADADIRESTAFVRPPTRPPPFIRTKRFPCSRTLSIVGHRAVQSQSPSKIRATFEEHHASGNFEACSDRYVSGEFAKAIKPLLRAKKVPCTVGQAAETEMLDRAVATHGPAVSTGDKFRSPGWNSATIKSFVDVNGGGRGKKIGAITIQIGLGAADIPDAVQAPRRIRPAWDAARHWAAPFSWNSTSSCGISTRTN